MSLQREIVERSEIAIDMSFDSIINGIVLPQEVINILKIEIKADFSNGAYKNSANVFKDTLSKFDWSWPEFDQWKATFEKMGKWPYIWVKNKAAYEKLTPTPVTIENALRLLRVTELKALAKKHNIKHSSPKGSKPIMSGKRNKSIDGRKKTQYSERSQIEKKIVESAISLEQIISSCIDRFQEIYEKQIITRRKGMAMILHHTILMTGFRFRNASEREYFPDIKYEALGNGCEVEEMYASLYNQGKLKGKPPFFPGDRTSLIPVVDIP